MKRTLIALVVIVSFLTLALYTIFKVDAKKSGLPKNAFSQQVYYGGFSSGISSTRGNKSSGGGFQLGQFTTSDHTEYLEDNNNLDNYISDKLDRKKMVRLFEVADMILMPDMRDASNIINKRNADYFLTDIVNENEEEAYFEGGVVKFKRSGSDEFLTYITPERYEQYKQENDLETLKKHFTLNEEGSIVVISWSENTIEEKVYKDGVQESETGPTTTITYRDIVYNYKDYLKQYETKYYFFHALLIYGSQDTTFAYDFAKNVIENTDVVFVICDSENIEVEEKTTKYNEVITIPGNIEIYYNTTSALGNGAFEPVDFPEPYYTTTIEHEIQTKITKKEIISNIEIKKAEFWCAKYSNDIIASNPSVVEGEENTWTDNNTLTETSDYVEVNQAYPYFSEVNGKTQTIFENKRDELLDLVIIKEIEKYLENNKIEDNEYYDYMIKMSNEFVQIVSNNENTLDSIKTIVKEKYEAKIALEVNAESRPADVTEDNHANYDNAINRIAQNLVDYIPIYSATDYASKISSVDSKIFVKETREKKNYNFKSKITTTTNLYTKQNSLFEEKTDLNEENFVSLYQSVKNKIDYNWLTENLKDLSAAQDTKDMYLYMVKVAHFGKEKAGEITHVITIVNDLNNQTVIRGINSINTNMTREDLVLDREKVISMIENLTDQRAKDELNENIDKIMSFQSLYKINAVFVIAAVETEYNGLAQAEEGIDVSEFLEEIKETQDHGITTVEDFAKEYANGDQVWEESVIQNIMKLYRAENIVLAGEIEESGDGYPNKYMSSSGYVYCNYKQNMGSYKDRVMVTDDPDGDWVIKPVGCFFTSVSICVSGKTGEDINPGKALDEVKGNQKEAGQPFKGSYYYSTHLYHYGMSWKTYGEKTSIEEKKEAIINHLKRGLPVIVRVNNPPQNEYTREQHYMAILDLNYENTEQVYLSNPWNGPKTGWQNLDNILVGCKQVHLIEFNNN